MPAFQSPSNDRKRKTDDSKFFQNKKQALDSRGHSLNQKCSYWMVQWRHPQYKKHKTWDGDAVMKVQGNICYLYDSTNGDNLGYGKPSGIESVEKIEEGSSFTISGKEVEVDHSISDMDYKTGKCFEGGITPSSEQQQSSTVVQNYSAIVKQFKPLRPGGTPNGSFKPPTTSTSATATTSRSNALTLKPVEKLHVPGRASSSQRTNSFWYVNWRKPQQKKHKTWDGDAYLTHISGLLTLVSEKGVILGTKNYDGEIQPGFTTFLGGKEIEVDSEISQNDVPRITGSSSNKNFGEIEMSLDSSQASTPVATARYSGMSSVRSPGLLSARSNVEKDTTQNSNASSFYSLARPKPKKQGPLHDPDAEGALVMHPPDVSHAAKYNTRGGDVVPVVVDPLLVRHLRPHQVEGVKFMFECVTGMKHDGLGCILADDMGLGKTLQTITLVWTLLSTHLEPLPSRVVDIAIVGHAEQNHYKNSLNNPIVQKVLVVCPVSLINNWRNEFRKWLGRDRLGVMVIDKPDKTAARTFASSKVHTVLIIGYERLRSMVSELKYSAPKIGLIICDEGHRLKSANNKTLAMFDELTCTRRIILSGTPIQNDLGEFHAMADFCNPGMLNNYASFKKLYENPILKSRAPGCSSKEKELGEERFQALMDITKSFVLRREANILKNYLPPKYEFVVFITPTKLQRNIFYKILTTGGLDTLVRNSTAESLALIAMLTKISNSPILLKASMDKQKEKGNGDGGDVVKQKAVLEACELIPADSRIEDVALSGKLQALSNLLKVLYKSTEEKCIIVSHYTSTLSVIEAYCRRRAYTYLRLDGSTPASKRQEFVNEFNRSSQKQRFIFLLSSKAGGVGLNLIGASRLCLIDSDWNPSHDLQSMARIHRDGQKRPVFIYRFLTAGSIDEKIYQRQVTKLGLSDSLLKGNSESKSDSFTKKDLRDIFTIYPNTPCHTHDLLECPCDSSNDMAKLQETSSPEDSDVDEDAPKGFMAASEITPEHIDKLDKEYLQQKKAQLAALGQWTHINCLNPGSVEAIQDSVLQTLVQLHHSRLSKGKQKPQSMLAAVDLENVLQETRPPLAVNDVPGGSVSFLFQRTSTTPPENTESDEQDNDELLS